MNNTRFATAIHILTLLGAKANEWLSSDYIAGSININPVMVRKELGVLTKTGLVITKKGKEGGAKLSKPSEEIFLSDIYAAVNHIEILGKRNVNTNIKCPIGKQINHHLSLLFVEIDEKNRQVLGEKNLSMFIKLFE